MYNSFVCFVKEKLIQHQLDLIVPRFGQVKHFLDNYERVLLLPFLASVQVSPAQKWKTRIKCVIREWPIMCGLWYIVYI